MVLGAFDDGDTHEKSGKEVTDMGGEGAGCGGSEENLFGERKIEKEIGQPTAKTAEKGAPGREGGIPIREKSSCSGNENGDKEGSTWVDDEIEDRLSRESKAKGCEGARNADGTKKRNFFMLAVERAEGQNQIVGDERGASQ